VGRPLTSPTVEPTPEISTVGLHATGVLGLASLRHVCDAIVALYGPGCEAVLHDFSDLEHSVVHVAGNVTGRAVGAPLTDLGLRVLRSGRPDQDVLAYHSKAPNGALMKSVSVLLRNEPGGPVLGALCLNLDIEQFQRTRELLNNLVAIPHATAVQEHYPSNAKEAIQGIVNDILNRHEWLLPDLSRDQRVAVVRALDQRGAFAFRSGPSIIAQILGISRFTVYKYLKEIRHAHDGNA
jgi:predicted transcriptional regulator YheO